MATLTVKGFVARHGIRAEVSRADSNPAMSDMPAGSAHYRVTLRRKDERMAVPFSTGPALCKEPTAEEVLDCLISDASGADQDFNDWARDLGYDTDSRKAERIYNAVVKQTEQLKAFLGDALFDELFNAERL